MFETVIFLMIACCYLIPAAVIAAIVCKLYGIDIFADDEEDEDDC